MNYNVGKNILKKFVKSSGHRFKKNGIPKLKRNYKNEFFLRLVMKKCNELKFDFKSSYKQSSNEVKWKNPTITNV